MVSQTEELERTEEFNRIDQRLYGGHEWVRLTDVSVKNLVAYLDREQVPLPKLDADLLREQVTWAKKSMEVEEDFGVAWNQEVWTTIRLDKDQWLNIQDNPEQATAFVKEGFCKTAGCLAGNIALKQAEVIQWEYEDQDYDDKGNEVNVLSAAWVSMGDGSSMTIESFARDQLGLTPHEANLLFNGYNSVEELELIATAICKRRGIDY